MRVCFWTMLSVMVMTLPVVAQEAPAASGPRLVTSWSDQWEPTPSLKSARLGSASARTVGRGAKWAIGGALVVGTISAAVGNALCERSNGCTGPTLTWGVIGAGVGAALGALIAKATE